jgi:hypothetical protein
LLNERRRTITEVTQDEVRQYLSLVEQEGWKRLESASEQATPTHIRSLAWLKFQLKPPTEPTFDPAKMSVVMAENDCRYSAECQAPPSQGVAETYLRFADAAAELNSVLHPMAPLPRPRLRLNVELRQKDVLPVLVDLQANLDPPLHLQAEHRWTWRFQPTDRQLISNWEEQLADSAQRHISFRQYQQECLSAEIAKSR